MNALENFVDLSPAKLKRAYVAVVGLLKKALALIGVLPWLDSRVRGSRRIHFLRSLFAIHQLDDMIWLDVPWWTYHGMDAVEKHLSQSPRKPRIFEYGSGASTIWLAKRAQSIISAEHDRDWYNFLTNALLRPELREVGEIVQIELHVPDLCGPQGNYSSPKAKGNLESYVKSIASTDCLFDVIVIDGRCRCDALAQAIPKLAPEGIIIFDNSNRARYQAALLNSGLQIERYRGAVPGLLMPSETAILGKHLREATGTRI